MAATAESEGSRFSCPACGRSFRWKPELAGKRAKCKCGATIDVPRADPGAARAAAPSKPAAGAKPPPPPKRAPASEASEPSIDDVFAAAEMELAASAEAHANAPPPKPVAPPASAAPAQAGAARPIPHRAKIENTSPVETYHSRWRGLGYAFFGAILCAYAYYEFYSLGRWEARGGSHRFFIWTRLIYAIAGRWGVVVVLGGLGGLMALLGVLAFLGKVHIEGDE